MFNCTAFDVRQRWSVLVPVGKQQELVSLAVRRRQERMKQREENTKTTTSNAVATTPPVSDPLLPSVVQPFRSSKDAIKVISQQVYIYNNSSTKLAVSLFWQALAKHLDNHNYDVGGIEPQHRLEANWYVMLEKGWKQLCTRNRSLVQTYVLLQPKSISNMNAVVHVARKGTKGHFVREWWRRHLFHNLFDVYCAGHDYVQLKTSPASSSDNSDTVERVMLNVLFAVVTAAKMDDELDANNTHVGAVISKSVLLPPFMYNVENMSVAVPLLPLPLSQAHKYDKVIVRAALALKSLPPKLADVRWSQLAITCRTNVQSVQRRWGWLSSRASAKDPLTTVDKKTADTSGTGKKDYVVVVPESVEDNYW
jgi:hypothetical protein